LQFVCEGVAARAAWQFAEEAGVFGEHLLVGAVGEEDEDPLGRRHEREDDEENQLRDFFGDRGLNIAEDPADSDRDEDGQIHSEFLLSISLIGFGGASKGLLDLAPDQEEEDHVDRDDDDTRNEERPECREFVRDIASSIVIAACRKEAIILEGSNNDDDDGGGTP